MHESVLIKRNPKISWRNIALFQKKIPAIKSMPASFFEFPK
jgi:hypothetical protein